MATKALSLPKPRPERSPEGLGSHRYFPAVSARVRASLVLRRLELERVRHETLDTPDAFASAWRDNRRSVHARPAA